MSRSSRLPVDLLTVLGISLLVFSVTVAMHESIHALVCVATGSTLIELSAQHVECNYSSTLAGKLVAGSSPIANIFIGLGLYFWLQKPNSLSGATKFALWLFMLANLLSGAGYLPFSGLMGVGDFAAVIDGWEPAWLWRTILVVFGFALFMFFVALGLRLVGQFIGGTEQKEQIGRLQKIGLVAYVGAILTAVAAGFFNSQGGITGFPAIAGIFAMVGGQSPLAWMAQWFQAEMFKKDSAEINLTFPRSWPYIIAGLVAVIIYAVFLGPGIRFGA